MMFQYLDTESVKAIIAIAEDVKTKPDFKSALMGLEDALVHTNPQFSMSFIKFNNVMITLSNVEDYVANLVDEADHIWIDVENYFAEDNKTVRGYLNALADECKIALAVR